MSFRNHVSLLSVCFPGLGKDRRQKQDKGLGDKQGAQCPFTPSPSCLPFLRRPWRTGLRVFVPAQGSRGLPGSHGPGMCSLLHFYHNNSLINSPAAAAAAAQTCASEGVGHVALPEPREGARSALPPPLPSAGAAAPQEIPSAPSLLQNMFLGSDFQ